MLNDNNLPDVDSDVFDILLKVKLIILEIFGVLDHCRLPLSLVVGVIHLLGPPLSLEVGVVNDGGFPLSIHIIVPVFRLRRVRVGDCLRLLPVLVQATFLEKITH